MKETRRKCMNGKTKDKTESARVRRFVRAKPKQCYLNAFRAIQQVAGYAHADYVEGLAVMGKVLVIEHGWIERDDIIVDPTLPQDDLNYFPGLRFTGQRGLAEAIQIPGADYSNDLPFFYRFGWVESIALSSERH
jgi:hypothetical protein